MTRRGPLLADGASRLRAAGVASPEVDAELLLAFVLRTTRARLSLADDPSADQVSRFQDLITRRSNRVPLQHLTGRAPFRHLELQVGPGVFVPRPETESLAGWAIDVLAEVSSPIVVDLCTGSGALAAAIADEVPGARVHAVDVDEVACGWAERNLSGSGTDLRIGDIESAFHDLDGTVDLVVANPPYIPLTAWESVETEVRDHDPAVALWSGADGLDAIRSVERAAARLVRPEGWAGCEHAAVQADSAPAIFAGSGHWNRIQDHPDLAGRPRYLTARRI